MHACMRCWLCASVSKPRAGGSWGAVVGTPGLAARTGPGQRSTRLSAARLQTASCSVYMLVFKNVAPYARQLLACRLLAHDLSSLLIRPPCCLLLPRQVMLRPASDGTGVIAGGAVRVVLELAGVKNGFGKQLGTANPLNNARATLEGIKSMRTFQQVANMRGLPVADLMGLSA